MELSASVMFDYPTAPASLLQSASSPSWHTAGEFDALSSTHFVRRSTGSAAHGVSRIGLPCGASRVTYFFSASGLKQQ